jgi:hypothetical protein
MMIQSSPSTMPPRVEAAMRFLDMMRAKESGTNPFGTPATAESLSPQETKVQRQAMQVLLDYFSGEMDFGDAPPRRSGDADDDGDVKQLIPA